MPDRDFAMNREVFAICGAALDRAYILHKAHRDSLLSEIHFFLE